MLVSDFCNVDFHNPSTYIPMSKKQKKKHSGKGKNKKNQVAEKKVIAPMESKNKWEIKKITLEVGIRFFLEKMTQNVEEIIGFLKEI